MSESPQDEVYMHLELPEGMHVRITVERLAAQDENDTAAEGSARIEYVGDFDGNLPRVSVNTVPPSDSQSAKGGAAIRQGLFNPSMRLRAWPFTLASTLFGLALLVYLATRLVGLTEFPIYFFTDEAVQTILAADLVRDGMHNYDKVFLPTYFKNGDYYNLSVSVYLQVLPYVMFGKSAFVTRAVSVLVGLIAAASVSLILRDFFHSKYWWSGALLLSITPAWFLHSRTAFETVLFVAFYAGMVYFYLLYRCRSPHYAYATLVFAGLAFYSYSPGQLLVGLTGVILLVLDLPYHWRNRSTNWRAALLGVVIALPYLRFQFTHSSASFHHLRLLNSYWVQPIPFAEKVQRYIANYRYGLSIGYWFIPNEADLPRHLMKNYGHLQRVTLPFVMIGLYQVIRQIRKPQARVMLVVLLVAPAGSALVGIGITRVLVMVIPAAILTVLGIDTLFGWIERLVESLKRLGFGSLPDLLSRSRVPRIILAFGLFLILTAANLRMTQDALVNGPTWYGNYGMGGLQYGAFQIFPLIENILDRQPETEIILTPTWANGTDVVARFFLYDPLPIGIGSVEGYISQQLPLDENTLFIMTPEEYLKVLESGKFSNVRVERTLPYPDGRPGFYFVKMEYVDNIDAIFEAERQARRELREATVTRNEETFKVRYPVLDMGDISSAFDGDDFTVLRTLEANPAVFEIHFQEARLLSGVRLVIGSLDGQIDVKLYAVPDATPVEINFRAKGSVDKPDVQLDFGGAYDVQVLRLEIEDVHQQEPAHVHVWEIEFLEP